MMLSVGVCHKYSIPSLYLSMVISIVLQLHAISAHRINGEELIFPL